MVYDLLDPTQRAVFERLAVFSGGFTVESAQQVCDDVVADAPVERVLDDLVVRSLLRRQDRPYGTRYRMLEVIRLFADEHLTARPRHDEIADTHASAMVRQLERVRHEVFGPDEAAWAAWFDDERANVFFAHRRLIDRCRVASSLGLAVACYLLSFPRARADIDAFPSEALAGLDRCNQSAEGLEAVLAEALGLAADAAVHAGETERAEQLIARGVDLGRSAPGVDRFCLSVAADLALFRGDTAGAATFYEEAEAGCLEWDEPSLAAWMSASAALARSYHGHADDQVGTAFRALERAEHLGSPSVRGFCRYVLGEVIAMRDANESKRQLESAVVDSESVGASFIAGLARLSLATDAARRREPSAGDLYRALVDLWQRTGRWTPQWITIRSLAVMLSETGFSRRRSRFSLLSEPMIRTRPGGLTASRRSEVTPDVEPRWAPSPTARPRPGDYPSPETKYPPSPAPR